RADAAVRVAHRDRARQLRRVGAAVAARARLRAARGRHAGHRAIAEGPGRAARRRAERVGDRPRAVARVDARRRDGRGVPDHRLRRARGGGRAQLRHRLPEVPRPGGGQRDPAPDVERAPAGARSRRRARGGARAAVPALRAAGQRGHTLARARRLLADATRLGSTGFHEVGPEISTGMIRLAAVGDFPIGFGRYQLVERLAVGGMAEVFRATAPGDHGFQKQVVVKRLLPHLVTDATYRHMFIDEAKLTARLVHPKIAQTFELGEVDGALYIAMEHVDGIDVL